MTKLSIILPSIRPHLLQEFYESIPASILPYDFELIVIGPYELPGYFDNIPNVIGLYDLGSPSRCVQKATEQACGEYMTWSSDDALYQEGALFECLALLDDHKEEDGLIVRYYEGINRVGKMPDDNYWTAWTHADQRLPGIPQHYRCCPVGMYNTEHFRWMGGLDCRFHHVNMNAHSLAFRIQNNGGTMHLSPGLVMACTFDNHTDLHKPLDIAYARNDRPLYAKMYSAPHDPTHIQINYDNWRDAPEKWDRFQ